MSPVEPPIRAYPWRMGRYEVLCQLAHGGMAVLYLARAVGPGGFERLFAIKMIHEHLSRERRFVEMFLDEARLVARIRHPNVVPVYEIGVWEERHFLCMEYLSGETLGAALTASWPKGEPFPRDLVTYVVASAAEGLHAAHELHGPNGESLGVIHRDVTPQNIMLGYDGSVRVMDFGVARARDQLSHSLPGTFKGTPAYMAPEQVRGLEMDRRSDVFALGVVLWEMTVGKRLFKGKNDVATTMNVLQRPITPPTRLLPDYPAELEGIVLRALERAPGARYATARDLAEALHRFELNQGWRTTAAHLERWMQRVFAHRLHERRAFEQRAMDTLDIHPLVLPAELSVASELASPLPELAAHTSEEVLALAGPVGEIDGLLADAAFGVDATRDAGPRPRPRRWGWPVAAALVGGAAIVLAATQGQLGTTPKATGPEPPATVAASPEPPPGHPAVTEGHLTDSATVAPSSTPPSDPGQDRRSVRPRSNRGRGRSEPGKWGKDDPQLYRGSDL